MSVASHNSNKTTYTENTFIILFLLFPSYREHSKNILISTLVGLDNSITGEVSANGYQFSIKDNGIGIAPEYHEHVFSMFKRLHHRGEYQGSGLGLAICQKIIQRMGGSINIAPETA